jgi:transposase
VSLKEQIAHKEAQLIEKDAKIEQLKSEIDQLKKLIFGSKSERYRSVEVPPEQGNLFSDPKEEPVVIQATEKIPYTRKKANNHKGRNTLPAHLPVTEVVIEPQPEQIEEGMIKIGEEITETLDYTPASLIIIRTIRPKYARKSDAQEEDGKNVVIAPMPSRVIDKAIADPGLLAYILVCKFIDHLPFYRQIQIFKREFGWEPSKSTVNDWFIAVCTLLEPLYDRLKEKLLESEYIQADESPLKVQDSKNPGKTHRGYQWVYHCPKSGLILFHYHRSRSVQAPKELLLNYKGWVQCDGYKVYDKLDKVLTNIRLAGCWVHARRKYHDALKEDQTRAKFALDIFKKVYRHESICKDYTSPDRKSYRLVHVQPLVLSLKTWIERESISVLPKSAIGKAMTYTLKQWSKLIACLEDGRLELDNNLIENKIRPLALGRKNYLFAGSHPAAQRIAMMYSFFATCKRNEINPHEWLKDTLLNIRDTKMSNLDSLLPIKKMT